MNRPRAGGFRHRWRRVIARALVALLAFMALFPPAYAVLVPERRPEIAPFPVPTGRYRVFVADWGYHTSIVVEQPRGWRLGPAGEETAPFVEYAWGDRRFYYASDFRPPSRTCGACLTTRRSRRSWKRCACRHRGDVPDTTPRTWFRTDRTDSADHIG
jgi:hypothetical protein